MTRPEKATEPSMDEILASIRRIISEEPPGGRAAAKPALQAVPPTPLPVIQPQPAGPQFAAGPFAAPAPSPAAAAATRAPPSFIDLAAIRRAEAPPQLPMPPEAATPAQAADEDNLDLVEEAPAATQPIEPQLSPIAARPGLGGDRPRHLPPRAEAAAPPAAALLPAANFAAPPQPRPLPFPFGPKPPKARPAAAEQLPTVEASDELTEAFEPPVVPVAIPAVETTVAERPSDESQGSRLIAQLRGTKLPEVPATALAAPAVSGADSLLAALRAAPNPVEPAPDVAHAAPAEVEMPARVAVTPEPEPEIAAPVAVDMAVAEEVPEVAEAEAPAVVLAAPVEVVPAAEAIVVAEVVDAARVQAAAPVTEPPAAVVDAATPSHGTEAAPVVAAVAGAAMLGSAMVAAKPAAESEILPPAPISVKTLEDTVAELLKPMLRQWLDDNMPRIMEKALKEELAPAPKSNGVSH